MSNEQNELRGRTVAPSTIDAASKIRNLLIAGVLVLNSLVLVIAVLNLSASRERAVESVRQMTGNLANMLQENLAQTSHRIDLALLSLGDSLEHMLADEKWSDQAVGKLLETYDARYPEVRAFRLIDKQGMARWGKGTDSGELASYADREDFMAHQASPGNQIIVSGPIKTRWGGVWAIALTRSYRYPDGTFAGMISATIPVSYLNDQLARLDLGPHGSVNIRHNQNGALMTRHPPAPGPGGETGNQQISPEFKAIIESGEPRGSFYTPKAPDGFARTYAYRRIPGMPMIVNVGMAPQDYLTTWYKEVTNTALLFGAFFILSVMTARMMLRYWQRTQRDTALLLAGESRFRSYVDSAPEAIFVADSTGRYVDVNPAACNMVGYSREELCSMRITDLSPEGSADSHLKEFEEVKKGLLPEMEIALRCKDGHQILVLLRTMAMEDGHVIGFCIDITEKKKAEEAVRLYAKMFEYSGEALVITDRANHILAINNTFSQMTGYTPEEVIGKDPKLLASGQTPPETYQMMWASLRESGNWQGELWDRRKDGSIYPKWATISTIRDPRGDITHHIASFTDISERKAAEARIERLAHQDVLTGLLNRYSLESRLEQALLSSRREGNQLAVLFIDMDRFKVINDTLGHAMGDLLLQEVSGRLRASVRESDIVARQGGDEFVVVLTHLDTPADAMPVTEKLLQALSEPYAIEGQVMHSSPSIGVAMFPEDADNVADLLKDADTAMYAAKEGGRKKAHFFTASLMEQAEERLLIERELRAAVQMGQLELHYQPQIVAQDGRICGLEALVRWCHPQRGLVPPLKFIPIAEETGLIDLIGAWVLNEACRQQAAWRDESIDVLVAVNISAHQLRSPELVNMVQATLDRHGLKGGCLELEVTESAAMDDPEAAIKQLVRLRDMGIRLAIDDFGTGYSSLAYLKRLPIQTLKLDRSFVIDIETDQNDAAICAATIALAHTLGLKVVAEGVETQTQCHFLTEVHGCDILQGFLLGRPEPGTAITSLLQRSRVIQN